MSRPLKFLTCTNSAGCSRVPAVCVGAASWVSPRWRSTRQAALPPHVPGAPGDLAMPRFRRQSHIVGYGSFGRDTR